MKKAIEFLMSKNITCKTNGEITGRLPSGTKGITLINELEDITTNGDQSYTIINNRLQKIDC